MHHPPMHTEDQRLNEEIGAFKSRLAEISNGRDSAYEKALMRSYETMIQDRQSRLAELRRPKTI